MIEVKSFGFLPSGTIILCGAGLIKVGEDYSARRRDIVTVFCPQMGELKNAIV